MRRDEARCKTNARRFAEPPHSPPRAGTVGRALRPCACGTCGVLVACSMVCSRCARRVRERAQGVLKACSRRARGVLGPARDVLAARSGGVLVRGGVRELVSSVAVGYEAVILKRDLEWIT